jgi:hypothetical protein
MNVYHPIRVLTNLLTRASKTLFFSPNSCLLELWASSLISPHRKEGGIYCCVALYHFFNQNVVFAANVRECIMSPPTDMISPCRRRQSLVSLYKKWCCEKKTVRFCYESFFYKDLHSHFYNSCAVIRQTRDLEFLNACRQDVAPPLLPLPCVYLNKQQYQKNGEKLLCFDSFTLLSLTCFQLNCHFWGECEINGIAAHRPMFAPSPLLPACIN